MGPGQSILLCGATTRFATARRNTQSEASMNEETKKGLVQTGFGLGVGLLLLLSMAAEPTVVLGWLWRIAVFVFGPITLIVIAVIIWARRCRLFGHRWVGCICQSCHARRDENHDFQQCHCVRCGVERHKRGLDGFCDICGRCMTCIGSGGFAGSCSECGGQGIIRGSSLFSVE